MLKKIILSALVFVFCQTSFAETCPSVSDLKAQKLPKGWMAYDTESGSPLDPKQIAELSKHIEQFALAEWSTSKKSTGAIHCYYRDQHGSDLEAYFSKKSFTPDNTKHAWYQVSGYMHCAAGMNNCSFQTLKATPEPQKQLATK